MKRIVYNTKRTLLVKNIIKNNVYIVQNYSNFEALNTEPIPVVLSLVARNKFGFYMSCMSVAKKRSCLLMLKCMNTFAS